MAEIQLDPRWIAVKWTVTAASSRLGDCPWQARRPSGLLSTRSLVHLIGLCHIVPTHRLNSSSTQMCTHNSLHASTQHEGTSLTHPFDLFLFHRIYKWCCIYMYLFSTFPWNRLATQHMFIIICGVETELIGSWIISDHVWNVVTDL